MTRYFLQKGIPDKILVLGDDGQLVEAEEIELANQEEEEDAPAPIARKQRSFVVNKARKVCKNCGKPGHMRKTCPDMKPMDSDFMPVASKEDVLLIWDCVDDGVTDYKDINHRTGLPVRLIEQVLLKPRP